MPKINAAILREAIAWHVRLPELDGDGWDRFTLWLEADPAHADIYDRVSLYDAERAALRLPKASNDNVRWWKGGAIAGGTAAIAASLLLVMPHFSTPQSSRYDIEAGAARRSVALGDGTRIDLAPGARVTLDKHNARFASLASGMAVFTVKHDATRPFEVLVGDHVARDLGTVFEVVKTPDEIRVSVASGEVEFDPATSATHIAPGERLSFDQASGKTIVVPVAADSVGEWRGGRLRFADEPLGRVVDALSLATGTQVTLGHGLSGRRFTGMVHLSGDAGRDVAHFAALTGLTSKRDGDHWVIAPVASTGD
ncbi:FecR family protein [Sphingomonas immobilis]|uniref:FecR domain-containing protein n=1 Tax=Sphingomonas immobilis TaxID=3063997 RepID=A0ABT9A1U2_9SPHN|nr:FecR domain-containing protein [Sphingomonas sp. CA1-15]MDO7843803.1 FecR domain-containing protein [Sphingomonas sp. CA1-15]